MRAGQQLEQDYRSVARDSCSRAVKDFAFAALDVGLYETNARQAGFVERADFNIIALDVPKLDVTSLQAAGEVALVYAEPRFGPSIRLCSYVANPLSRSQK